MLEEVGVALLPGTAFGQGSEQLTARLAFVDFDGTTALDWYLGNECMTNQVVPGIKSWELLFNSET